MVACKETNPAGHHYLILDFQGILHSEVSVNLATGVESENKRAGGHFNCSGF